MPVHSAQSAHRDPATLLNRGLALLAGAHAIVLAAAALAALRAGLATPWLRVGRVALVMAVNLFLLWLGRRRFLAGENLHSIWGPANLLTAARGVLIALLAGFLFAPAPPGPAAWAPAILYTTMICLDFLDGWWARRSRTQTRMGAILDQEYDAFGILVAVLLAIQQATLPVAFTAVAAARYLFVLGLAVRRRRGLAVYELPPSYLRRRLAGFQMGVLAVFLCPVARPPATTLAETMIGLPLLAGFLRDWLLATGQLSPANPAYLALKRLVYRLARRVLSPLLRVLLAAAVAQAVWELARRGSTLPALAAAAGLPCPELAGSTWGLLRLALLAVLAAGHLVSPAALALLLLEGARVFLSSFDLPGAGIITAALLLYLFGPGPGRLAHLVRAAARALRRALVGPQAP